MLGLLVSSCGRRSQFLQLPRYHMQTKVKTASVFSTSLKNINKLVRNSEAKPHLSAQGTSKSKGLLKHALIFGGFEVSVALCGRHFLYKHQVRCEGNRLSGALQDDNKLDSKDFWSSLMSYLRKLLCAITEALSSFKTLATNASILLSAYLLPPFVTIIYIYLVIRMGGNPLMIKLVDKVADDLNLPIYEDLKHMDRDKNKSL